MRRPRVVEKIRQRDRCGNFMVEDDGIAEFPDAQAEKKSKRERVKFRRDFAFRFHAPSLCLQPVQKAIYGDQAQLPVLRFWRLCWPVQLLVLALWPAFAKRTSVKSKFIVVLLLALSIVIMALLFFYREIPRGPEQAGEVPKDATPFDWRLAQRTSWWGKPLDPKDFWKGLGEIAGDGQQDRGAPLGQAVQRYLRRHDAERTAPGPDQAAAGGRQVHGHGAARAQVHLHDIAGPQLASQHRGQCAERGPQLHLIARQPHLRGSPRGAGCAGGQVRRDVGAAEISWPFHQVRLDRDRDRPQPRDVDLGRVGVRRGAAARVTRGLSGEAAPPAGPAAG